MRGVVVVLCVLTGGCALLVGDDGGDGGDGGALEPDAGPPAGLIYARTLGGLPGLDDVAGDATVDESLQTYVCATVLGNVTLPGDDETHTNAGAGTSDILVVKLNAEGAVLWSQLFGGSGNDSCSGIAVNGELVALTGRFEGSAAFGDMVSATSEAAVDSFVTRLDAMTGEAAWAQVLGGDVSAKTHALAVSGNSRIAVGGTTIGPIFAGGATDGAFVASYLENSLLEWGLVFSNGFDASIVHGLAFDTGNNLYAAGRVAGPITTALASCQPADEIVDGVLLRLDPGGGCQWAERLREGAPGFDSVAVAPDDTEVFVVGVADRQTFPSFGGTINDYAEDLGTSAIASRFDAESGGEELLEIYGGSGSDRFVDIDIDPAGNIAVVGAFDADVGFGGEVLSAAGEDMPTIVVGLYRRTDSALEHVDSFTLRAFSAENATSTPLEAVPQSIEVAGNTVLVHGTYSGSLYVDDSEIPVATSAGKDAFVVVIER